MITFKEYFEEEERRETVALVPGSFKPPHTGHYEMVKQYSQAADNVIVLISAPSPNSERKTRDGRVITPEVAAEIFRLYVNNLNNVDVVISDSPSPVKAAYDMIESPEMTGKRVILGASKKGGDWKRWSGVQDYVNKKGLDVDIVSPEETAVDIVEKEFGTPYSASNIRDNFIDLESIMSDVPAHVDASLVSNILRKL